MPLWWSAYFCFRYLHQWHFFLLPFVWGHCGVCFGGLLPHFFQTSPNPPIPQSAGRLQMMNLLNKQVKQSMTRTTCIILYILSVREDGFNIQYNISEEGCALTVQMSFMVFIRSLLYKTVFKSPHVKTGLTCPSTSIHKAFSEPLKVPTSPRHTHQ